MFLHLVIFLTWFFIILIVYTYAGYPVLLWFMQHFSRRPLNSANIQPDVTLIIPTYNEVDVIRRKIENSLALDYPKDRLQILIIDDDSRDGTVEIIQAYAGITLIQKAERSGKMASLQQAMSQATGEIIVMSDASPSYARDAIKQLVQHFHDPMIGIVVGTLAVWDAENAVAKPAGLYWKYEAAIRRWESKIGNTIAMHGNLYAIRKDLFPRLDDSTINDEWSIAMRVIQKGFRVVYEPDALSYDVVSQKMEDEFQRRVRINAGRYQAFLGTQQLWPWNAPMVIFEIISHKLFRLILPFFMLGALLFNGLAVLLPDTPVSMYGIFGLQILAYLLAFAGYLFEQNNAFFKIPNLAYYLTSSNIAAFFGFLRFVSNRQSVLWEKGQQDISSSDRTEHV